MFRAAAFLSFSLAASPALADCAAHLARDAKGTAALFSPGAAICRTALQTTGGMLYCFSEYPFRSEAALARAKRLETTLTHCFGAMTTTTDAAVNHPDSYDARHFDVEDARISLSVKDKGALGKTLVFLRVAKRD